MKRRLLLSGFCFLCIIKLAFGQGIEHGIKFSILTSARIRVSIDTFCTSWRVCVHDSSELGGISSVSLLDDPDGEIVIGGHYVFKNTSFELQDDPLQQKTINIEPPKRDFCFNVTVVEPSSEAYAPLYIVDVNGNSHIVELRYKSTSVEFSPPDSVGLVFKLYDLSSRKYDPPFVGEKICPEYLFINKKESTKTYLLKKAEVRSAGIFSVDKVFPKTGNQIKPGDTVRISVCFTGPDTMRYTDSLDLETDCFAVRLPLYGQAGTALIIAEDQDFGSIIVGTTRCRDVKVKNTGNKPLTLDSTWALNKLGEFSFDITRFKNKLPQTLEPGQAHNFYFCYSPIDVGSDTAHMDWGTDIREPYKSEIKVFSRLWGAGIKSGVNWDRATEPMMATAQDNHTVHRVNLMNTGTTDAELIRIWFDGTDADEFSIVATEFNINPPTYEGTVLGIGDTMWVDIEFKANLTKVPIGRPRTASLKTAAKLDSNSVSEIAIYGTFIPASVGSDNRLLPISLRPNPARNNI